MKITLLTLGDTRKKEILSLSREFEARLKGKWSLEHRVIQPCRLSENPGEKEIALALKKEGEEIAAFLEKHPRAYTVALAVEGELLTSETFAALFEKEAQTHPEFLFLIGSSHGLSEQIKSRCDKLISFSRMTLPHELCRLVFSEQVYRAYTILAKMKYHK